MKPYGRECVGGAFSLVVTTTKGDVNLRSMLPRYRRNKRSIKKVNFSQLPIALLSIPR